MGTLFGFVVGYVVGARAGARGFDELVDSARQIRESDEFQAFVALLKDHARGTGLNLSMRFLGDPMAAGSDPLQAARDRLN